jgi:hypothetical protein
MQVHERKCEVCGARADPSQTSAHLARVIFFCTHDGLAFHQSVHFLLAKVARSTTDCWAAVDAWLAAARRGEVVCRS